MSGKVLRGGQHAVFLHAANHGGGHARYGGRIRAEAARVDDRIRGIVVHIHDGREVDVHSRCTTFDRGNAAELAGESLLTRRTESHRGREPRPAAVVQAVRQNGSAVEQLPGSALHVGGDQERDVGEALQFVELEGRFEGRAECLDETADAQVLDPATDALVLFPADRHERATDARHDHLTDLVA
jgi:hypothetical protein